jgi:tRNA A-37 threonylcarbamoyl transferase component Bud32
MSSLLTPGAVFAGRYEIVRMLSHGGMGAVYEVIHRDTARRRALKVMLPTLLGDDSMRARFLLEARVTAEVASENLVETFDAGIDAATDQPFLVMELLKGSDLESWVQRGPVPWQEVVTLLSQVARGLDRTHAAGIVHRDLKPENLFVTTREDGAPLVKILDFGIAKVVNESAQKSTRSLGTPLYMAPEMLGRRTTTPVGCSRPLRPRPHRVHAADGRGVFRDREPRARVGPGALAARRRRRRGATEREGEAAVRHAWPWLRRLVPARHERGSERPVRDRQGADRDAERGPRARASRRGAQSARRGREDRLPGGRDARGR